MDIVCRAWSVIPKSVCYRDKNKTIKGNPLFA
uniref:Uncharacterized protein n=1 Tax=Rhizophora mucronata TaxID=61149 RepID=A0A2P2P1Z3_RHIMU